MSYDRATGRLEGATALERCAALAFAAGVEGKLADAPSRLFDRRRAIMSMIDQREIVVMLNDDARFAFPFGDGYWSLLLDRSFVYEDEIERFLRRVADVDYTFIDGAANFGFWSVLASSRPFGGHPVIAIEASSANAARLQAQRRAERRPFRDLASRHRVDDRQSRSGSAAPSTRPFGSAREMALGRARACEMTSLDSLFDHGLVSPQQRLVIKLDVEGMEIDAAIGGKRVLEGDTVLILEDHGADRDHTVSRYLLNKTPLPAFRIR